jgi:hypothetical protein
MSSKVIVACLLALGMALSAPAGLARGQQAAPSGRNPSAESLTQTLVSLNARYRTAGPAERVRLTNRLLTTAATRWQLLASLMETDPAAVLRVALPARVRSRLPSRVSAYLEKEAQLEGTLEILHEDWPTGGRYRYHLHSTGGRYSLHFANRQPTHLLTGARIRIRGVQIGTTLALDGSTSIQTVAPAPVPNTFGAQKTLVILVTFQNNPTEPYTLSDAQSLVFGTTSTFFLENSYQQTWLTGDAVGWYTIPLDSTTCDSGGIATYAEARPPPQGSICRPTPTASMPSPQTPPVPSRVQRRSAATPRGPGSTGPATCLWEQSATSWGITSASFTHTPWYATERSWWALVRRSSG